MARRILALKRGIRKWLVEEDELGLVPRKPFKLSTHKRTFQFVSSPDKVLAFRQWFQRQVNEGILEVDQLEQPWSNEYVNSAYRKGLVHSYLESKRDLLTDARAYSATEREFLREAFASPETTSKIQMIYTRTYNNLKGFSDEMSTQTSRILADGLAKGLHPEQIAEDMFFSIDGLSQKRAMVIARTEVIHAHAEGQLDGYEKLGVQDVGADVEWSTAGDSRVCSECAEMEGQVMKISEARGLIPKHPNCRCAWIPVEQV
jgi:SPP1 gp7 family putative phage head morphogenesis protein